MKSPFSASAQSLDDLLRKIYPKLLALSREIAPTRGANREIIGALFRLTNPRMRLSRTETRGLIFSCLGEFLWYMSGSDSLEFISHYISRYEDSAEPGTDKIHGAYGPRLFSAGGGINQIESIISLLSRKGSTRRAAISIFEARDTSRDYKDVPCTCTLQFFIREGFLHCMAHMRSNDAYIGLPHDIFCFTLLQEYIAVRLGVALGQYYHSVGSLHLYTTNVPGAEAYLDEGWQQGKLSMPAMPKDDPLRHLQQLLDAEAKIRTTPASFVDDSNMLPYWKDLALLLEIHRENKRKTPHPTIYSDCVSRLILVLTTQYSISMKHAKSKP